MPDGQTVRETQDSDSRKSHGPVDGGMVEAVHGVAGIVLIAKHAYAGELSETFAHLDDFGTLGLSFLTVMTARLVWSYWRCWRK